MAEVGHTTLPPQNPTTIERNLRRIRAKLACHRLPQMPATCILVAPPAGFEPATDGLEGRCSVL